MYVSNVSNIESQNLVNQDVFFVASISSPLENLMLSCLLASD
jgi:hypothetical protein